MVNFVSTVRSSPSLCNITKWNISVSESASTVDEYGEICGED